MKIEKLPSGSYRVRKTIDKKTYSFVFDHKPTQAEILDKVIAAKQECATGCEMTFEQAAKAYVELKRNVLSPRTIKDYAEMWKRLSKEFYTSKLCEITALDVQKEINLLSADRSAKTVYNYHGFISTILGTYVPELKLNTTLPKKRKNEPYIPSDDEVKKLIDYSKKTCDGKFYVPIVLGCFGMSRSEICALSVEDIKDGLVTISKGKVLNDKKEWVIKDIPKTTARIRTIPVPHDIIDIINKQGYVFDGHPNAISNFIDNACKALKIEHFSLHKLRHYFATRLSSENIDVETILSLGGWSTDYVMKNVYRHKVDDKVKDASKRLETIILS